MRARRRSAKVVWSVSFNGEMFALCAQVGKDARAPGGSLGTRASGVQQARGLCTRRYSGFGSLSSSLVVLSVTLGGATISAVCGRRHGAVSFAG